VMEYAPFKSISYNCHGLILISRKCAGTLLNCYARKDSIEMNRITRILIIFSIVSALAGCSENDSSNPVDVESTDIENLIESNFSLWKSNYIENYMFTYYSSPNDCPQADPFPPRIITVENSVVVSVYVPDFGTTISVGDSPTIDDVFSSMTESAASNPMIFSGSPADENGPPEFNQQYGFPESYFIDVSESECDGATYSVSEFQ
jgi:hypothetical protein